MYIHFFMKQQQQKKKNTNPMAIHVWACFHMKCQLWDTTNFMARQENFNTKHLIMFSIVPEMFVNSDTLHFSQTNVWQSHVCFKPLQM